MIEGGRVFVLWQEKYFLLEPIRSCTVRREGYYSKGKDKRTEVAGNLQPVLGLASYKNKWEYCSVAAYRMKNCQTISLYHFNRTGRILNPAIITSTISAGERVLFCAGLDDSFYQ